MTLTMLQSMLGHRLTLTVAIVVCAMLVRGLITRRIRRTREILTPSDRRIISTAHVCAVLVMICTVLMLWLPQIQEFILSITAIALAIVIATKELSLCLLGAVVARSSRAFAIGDWISVSTHFGEVIERRFFTTTIQEIDTQSYTYSGRTAVIPNCLFLSCTVVNQNFLRRYQFHSFSITIEPDAFPIDAEEQLQLRIEALTSHFSETAQRYHKVLEQRSGIDIREARPLIEFSTNDTAKLVTTLTVFCPTDEIPSLEKAMMREFLSWYRMSRGSTMQLEQRAA